jgi:hypothetical protein
VDAHLGGLPAAALQAEAARADDPRRRVAADLGVGAEADAAVDALGAQLLGLPAHLGGIDVLHELVERLGVVARVVRDADRRLVRLGERRDEVLRRHLERSIPSSAAIWSIVDLDEVRRLGPPAPRIASVGNLFVITSMTSVWTAGSCRRRTSRTRSAAGSSA